MKLHFSAVIVFFVSFSLFSLAPEPSTRVVTMGDLHPSLADDFSSAIANPAGLATLDPVIRYSGLDFRFSGTFWDIQSAFADGDVTELLPTEDGTYVGLGLLGPFDVGYAGDGLAWRVSVYSTIDIFYPNLAVSSEFTFAVGAQFTGGWGTSLFLSDAIAMDLGFSFRGFHEQRYLGEADAVELGSIANELSSLLEMPYSAVRGFGFNGGIITRFGEKWTASLSVRDLFTMEFVNRYESTEEALNGVDPIAEFIHIPIPNISVGGSWHPNLSTVEWFDISGVYFSFYNLLGGLGEYPVNYLLGIALGTEMVFWDFMGLRLGFSGGFPAIGLGFKFGGVDMDFAISGQELSNQPGVFSVVDFRFAVTFQTRPGKLSGNRE